MIIVVSQFLNRVQNEIMLRFRIDSKMYLNSYFSNISDGGWDWKWHGIACLDDTMVWILNQAKSSKMLFI